MYWLKTSRLKPSPILVAKIKINIHSHLSNLATTPMTTFRFKVNFQCFDIKIYIQPFCYLISYQYDFKYMYTIHNT